MDTPEWFDDAIRATQANYRRIDTTKRVCCLCGHNVMVATDRILKPEDAAAQNPWQPEIYSFCACAQAISLNIPGAWQVANLWLGCITKRSLFRSAREHRLIMLGGEPNPKLPEIHILGRAVEDS